MQNNLKITYYLVLSAIISIILHVAFYSAVEDALLRLHELTQGKSETKTESQSRIELRSVDIRDVMSRRTKISTPEETAKALKEQISKNRKVKEIFMEEELIKKPRPKLELSGLGRNLLKPKEKSANKPKPPSAPRPQIINIDIDKLADERLSLSRETIAKEKREIVDATSIPSLAEEGDLSTGSGKTFASGMRLSLPKPGEVKLPPPPSPMPADLDPAKEIQRTALAPAAADLPMLPITPGPSLKGKVVQHLDTLLNVSLKTFPDSRGGGTFQIDISPNPNSDLLRPISKDILFLIDSSSSISPRKLEQFKSSTIEALQFLTPSDRFNIVTFRTAPSQLFQDYINVSESSIQTAVDHLKNLQRGGMTDVYAGLSPYVKLSDHDPNRPLNVFLMTDAQSTVKNKLENDEIIRRISEINQNGVSIYSFSAGDTANRFLLDFLAYNNRGASLHVDRLEDFRSQLVGFITNHSDLIVSDLNYHITGGLGNSIFPKKLPHLYRGETLSIFGRYPKGKQELAIQIIGRNASGKLEELIYRGNIKRAIQSEHNLAIDWAAQKIFHLLAQRNFNPSPELTREIVNLAKRYNLYVPYL